VCKQMNSVTTPQLMFGRFPDDLSEDQLAFSEYELRGGAVVICYRREYAFAEGCPRRGLRANVI
jgi:hypothetical protein